MERRYNSEETPEGFPDLYYCNPEKNAACNKLACKHNTNAIIRECEATKEKKFALHIGEAATEKAYTPGQKN